MKSIHDILTFFRLFVLAGLFERGFQFERSEQISGAQRGSNSALIRAQSLWEKSEIESFKTAIHQAHLPRMPLRGNLRGKKGFFSFWQG